MGKKKKSSSESALGRSLIKDRFGNSKEKKMVSDNSMLHTTEVQDGYDWGRLNLQSVTEESSFQEFLSTAELAGTEFQAEKLNIKFISPRLNAGFLTGEEIKKAKHAHEQFKEALKIPRRPSWSCDTTPDELDRKEKLHFLEWRRSLAHLQEEHDILLTPYEKNLQFWRQLWRVVERSDVVVQIVDARNPLLFRCEDLDAYVKEISEDKINLILVNKADFLTEQQREYWAEYFSTVGMRVVFFSAHLAVEDMTVKEKEERVGKGEKVVEKIGDVKSEKLHSDSDSSLGESNDIETVKHSIAHLEYAVEENADVLTNIINRIEEIIGKTCLNDDSNGNLNPCKLLSRDELIQFFSTIHTGPKVTKNVTTIGLVGYPNVGKSSTINALMMHKKVSVSATPGKTKHFQTLYLNRDVLLCDCPGLVMPSFVFTKAEMILNGILPVDQMRDHVPPTNLVTSLIPRHVLENQYGIMLPTPLEGEDPNRPPTAEEFLNAYAYNRGFMTANGQPDGSRAARYVFKDYMNGKLLYCHAPPNVNQDKYHTWSKFQKVHPTNRIATPRAVLAVKPYHTTTEDIDKAFFMLGSQGIHTKGIAGKATGVPKDEGSRHSGSTEKEIVGKPWKEFNKHKNKTKKEKLRRVYAHLDQH